MKKKFLKRHAFIASAVLNFVYSAPLLAIPFQPGMQLVADPQLQVCLDQTVNANNWTTTEEVTELNCPNQGIQDLGGIEQLINLKQLNLSGNRLFNTYQLEQLGQLTVLDLSNNNLMALPGFWSLNQLRQLNLSGNSRLQATEVLALIQHNPHLTQLGVADIAMGNDLSWLPPKGPQGEYNLIELDISRTGQYMDLQPIMQYTNLKVLKAAGNQLQFPGPLDQLAQLETLDLSNNNLNFVGMLGYIDSLKLLDLRGNNLIPCNELDNLEASLVGVEFYRPASCAI
ncbi:MAG: leucine-rich repeat domain-containing protein [Methylomicrobium sp.]